jgi:hypothetical protein
MGLGINELACPSSVITTRTYWDTGPVRPFARLGGCSVALPAQRGKAARYAVAGCLGPLRFFKKNGVL